MTCESVRRTIEEVYDALGRDGSRAPAGLAVPTGPALARSLGYPEEWLTGLDEAVLEAFVGTAPLALELPEEPGRLVLDLGCGAGLDSLLLAGRGYRVVSVELSRPMLRRIAGATAHLTVHPVRARLPLLPLRSRTAHWVLMNGVANLVPESRELLDEIVRVLRPGGRFLAADLLVTGEIPAEIRAMPEAWAWCLGGAATEEQWRAGLEAAGFRRIEIEVLEETPPLARGLLRAEL